MPTSKPDAPDEDEPDGGSGWHGVLVLLFCLALGARVIDDLTGASTIASLARVPGHQWAAYLTAFVQVLALLAAGVAVDRYGITAVVGISLPAWAAVTASLAAFASLPPALYLAHAAAVATGCFFGVAIPAVARVAFPMRRRAWMLAVFNTVAILWLVLLPWFLSDAAWPPKPPAQPAWAIGCLVSGCLVGLLAMVWWLTFGRRTNRPARAVALDAPADDASLAEAAALFRRPGMLALVVVVTCHMQVFAMLYRVTVPYMLTERFVPGEAFVLAVALPLLASLLAQIGFAFWSDRRARRTGRPAAARTPFIVAGAILTATIGLFPLVGRPWFGAIYWALAFGMAAYSLAFTLGFDLVPRAYAGRFLGTASAFSVVVNAALFLVCGLVSARTHSLACYFYAAGLAALVGAAVSIAKLRDIEPFEREQDSAVGNVFA